MHRTRDRQLARKVGAAIAQARRARSWTQEQLAEAVDISTNHAGLLERGQRLPSLGMLVDLAEALGLSLDEVLLRGQGERRRAGGEAAELVAAMPDELRPLAMAFLRAGASAVPKRKRR